MAKIAFVGIASACGIIAAAMVFVALLLAGLFYSPFLAVLDVFPVGIVVPQHLDPIVVVVESHGEVLVVFVGEAYFYRVSIQEVDLVGVGRRRPTDFPFTSVVYGLDEAEAIVLKADKGGVGATVLVLLDGVFGR